MRMRCIACGMISSGSQRDEDARAQLRGFSMTFVTTRKKFPRRDYTLAAWFDYDMDVLAKYLETTPTSEMFADGGAFPPRYRSIYLCLRDDRYASLTQTENNPERIGIDLELRNFQLLDEADLLDVISILPPDIGGLHRMDNAFTWVLVGNFERNG